MEGCAPNGCFCDSICCYYGDCCPDYDHGQCAAQLGSCFQQTGGTSCPSGLEVNADETACIDIDECANGSHNCNANQICENAHASFICNDPPAPVDVTFWISELAPNFESFSSYSSSSQAQGGETALWNYGCMGNGDLQPFSINSGKPVDAVDVAIHSWKKCVRCSVDQLNPSTTLRSSYEYPIPVGSECDATDAFENAVCECDKAFATVLGDIGSPNLELMNLDKTLCDPVFPAIAFEAHCCLNDLGSFQMYLSPSEFCCGVQGLRPAGTCATDEGTIYSAAIQIQ